ncbi:hypothetical protein KM759_gp073 [Lymphocystis disease virus 4]|uniref:Uncharacterized protein n=1 Tax=Lymphocystis disease virus 4 TaxID=2704413 RepID=A0A6B9XK04_9VIRU|nr:hypothetical protein KM759_gp073 [Lymphocystis disease virus 4]QHR78555.1 hypothetical protein [Lymphocystis disease virus 4]
MLELSKCLCQDSELPKKGDIKMRMEPEFGVETLNKLSLTGKPIRTFIAGCHIFVQYKDEFDNYHIIIMCQKDFSLLAVSSSVETICVKDHRLIEYIASVWNYDIIKKKLT